LREWLCSIGNQQLLKTRRQCDKITAVSCQIHCSPAAWTPGHRMNDIAANNEWLNAQSTSSCLIHANVAVYVIIFECERLIISLCLIVLLVCL
jgi:hypothetical protein